MSEKIIQRRRLSGWHRIGIVLSVLWLIGKFAYELNKETERAYTSQQHCYEVWKSFNECPLRIYTEWPWAANVVLGALLQIGIAWLCVYIIVVTVRWIVRGW
jgi:hypothetical protein